MTSQPTLSVLMPNYNHARFLPVAFASVFAQSRQPDEIIVIDDASTDNSLDVLEELATRHPRFTIIRNEKNLGVSRNLNRLTELCRTTHGYYFAADDVSLPGMFERSMALLAAHPEAGLCSGMSRRLSHDGKDLGDLVNPVIADEPRYVSPEEAAAFLFTDGQWLMGNTCVYRMDAVRRAGGFHEDLFALSDWLLGEVLALRHGACYIPDYVAYFRENPNGFAARTFRDIPLFTDIVRRAMELMETEYADVYTPTYREIFRKFLCRRYNTNFDIARLNRRERRPKTPGKPRIVHVSTHDTLGASARSASRLHGALRDHGLESLMVCAVKNGDDPDVLDAYADLAPTERSGLCRLQDCVHRYVRGNRVWGNETLFSASAPGADLTGIDEVAEADVLILHGVAGFVAAETLAGLLDLGKPVVWVLHDLWPMTGGCHYVTGCQGYRRDCRECPQISSSLWALPPAVLEARRQALAGRPLTVVTPSRWLADRVRESVVFAGCRVETIPDTVDSERFRPEPRAKRRLGLPDTLACVLFVAANDERRKGFALLVKAMKALQSRLPDGRLADGRRLALCVVGKLAAETLQADFPVLPCGTVADNAHLRRLYAACDVLAAPSLEENCPAAVLEAMACACPVVGFATGGLTDMVEHGVTGLLGPVGEVDALADLLRECLEQPAKARDMGRAGRTRVEELFTAPVQARRYRALLDDLAQSPQPEFCQPVTPARHFGLPRPVLLQAMGHGLDDAVAEAKARAFTLRDAGRAEDGARLLAAQLLATPDNIDLLSTYGGLLAAAGKTDDAVASFRRCLNLEPGRVDRYTNISDAYRYAGRNEEALAALAPLATISPWHRGLALKRGQALLAMGACRAAARELLREARLHGCGRSRELLREAFSRREHPAQRQTTTPSPA